MMMISDDDDDQTPGRSRVMMMMMIRHLCGFVLLQLQACCASALAMGSFCCKRRAEVLEQPEPITIPKAPRYDDEGFCLTPRCRNRRPLTHEFVQQ